MTSSFRSSWPALLLRRAFQVLAVGLIVGTLSFLMARALPGDMATRIAASRYGYDLVSNAAADAVRAELGLDRPAGVALLHWWLDLAQLRLGTSLVSGETVWSEVAHELGATLQLAGAATLIAAMVGLPLGVLCALRPGGWTDRAVLAASAVLRALPPFLLALLLMLAFALHLGVLPVAGDDAHGSLLLPAATLGLGLAAGLARVTRSALLEARALPSYEFARTKGLGRVRVLLRHGLRAAAVPVLAYLGVQTVFLMEGAVVVESLFAWPGIGHALVHAVFGRDVPMIQGTALCMGLLFVAFNLAVDAACLLIDPRTRVRSEA
jgi:peptide/nickel transport system permease protein